jgi:hypothetical protein
MVYNNIYINKYKYKQKLKIGARDLPLFRFHGEGVML